MARTTTTTPEVRLMCALSEAEREKEKAIREQEKIVEAATAALEILRAEKAGIAARWKELYDAYYGKEED